VGRHALPPSRIGLQRVVGGQRSLPGSTYRTHSAERIFRQHTATCRRTWTTRAWVTKQPAAVRIR